MAVYRTLTRGRGLVAATVGVLVAVALAASPAVAQTAGTSPPFASGAVTSVHGASVQVTNQRQNLESTVVLAPTTQVTKRVTATVSAITVGACVLATGTGSASKGITARSVSLSAATSSGCTAAAGGAGRRRGREVPLRKRAAPTEVPEWRGQRSRRAPGELRARDRPGGLDHR